MLTKKLIMLLALVTAQQCQTLTKLDIAFMQETPDKIIFTVREIIKTTRPGKHLEPIEIAVYHQDLRLCFVHHIKHYLAKTHAIGLFQHQTFD